MADFAKEDFYEQLDSHLARWQNRYYPNAPEPGAMRHQGDFISWLRAASLVLGRRVVLIIDEFDAIPMETVKALLSQFRAIESLSGTNDGAQPYPQRFSL